MPIVLVVEDDFDLQELLRIALEDEGFTVEIAADGREAAEAVARRAPHLAILDWMLPDTDGMAVAAHIKTVCGNDVPILLLTADHMGTTKAEQMGAFAFLPKPFDLDELTETVRRGIADP